MTEEEFGAPDLVVEITSDSTMKKDYNEKFNVYQENGVREYWIVNPDSQSMEVFTLVNEIFESAGIYNIREGATNVKSIIFPELKVDLIEVFKDQSIDLQIIELQSLDLVLSLLV